MKGGRLKRFNSMKNTHLQHPEDSILTGDLSVLDWFLSNGEVSAKIDGAPAIVWGTNPATGEFFVGTKSVFNKKLIKINETHSDIDRNHSGVVANILHHCFDYLPRIDGIIQGDFIGFGGDDTYTPNTLTYVFPEVIEERVIMAPHTFYVGDKMSEMDAFPILSTIDQSRHVHFVQPTVDIYNDKANWEEFDRCFNEVKEADKFLSVKRAFKQPSPLNEMSFEIQKCVFYFTNHQAAQKVSFGNSTQSSKLVCNPLGNFFPHSI